MPVARVFLLLSFSFGGLAACASPQVTSEVTACHRLAQTAEAQANAIALARDEQMKLMRFASQDAMDAYRAETDTWSMHAIRMVVLLNQMTKDHGMFPYQPDVSTAPGNEAVMETIEAANQCAAKLSK